MRLRNSPTTAPRTIRTDHYIIDIFPKDGIMKWYKTGIKLGQVVKASKYPLFTLSVKKFEHHRQEFKQVLSYLELFGEEL